MRTYIFLLIFSIVPCIASDSAGLEQPWTEYVVWEGFLEDGNFSHKAQWPIKIGEYATMLEVSNLLNREAEKKQTPEGSLQLKKNNEYIVLLSQIYRDYTFAEMKQKFGEKMQLLFVVDKE